MLCKLLDSIKRSSRNWKKKKNLKLTSCSTVEQQWQWTDLWVTNKGYILTAYKETDANIKNQSLHDLTPVYAEYIWIRKNVV